MKQSIHKLPQELQNLIMTAHHVSVNKKIPAYLVGGFVRDMLLGVKNFDLDIVVEGNGIAFAEEFARKTSGGLTTHKRFGTASVIVGHSFKVDIATAREESYPFPATLPVVTPSFLRYDLKRRDFTINAMAIDIGALHFGACIDLYHGKEDLAAQVIRILHDNSFIDDPTRMVRAIRFEQRFGFHIEPHTLRLLKKAARLRMLEKVQPQRTRDELIVILKEKNPMHQLQRLEQLVGVSFLIRGLRFTQKSRKLLAAVEKQMSWFASMHAHRRQIDQWLMRFMVLIDALDLKDTRRVLEKFAFHRGEDKRVLDSKKAAARYEKILTSSALSASQVYSLLEPLSYEGILFIKARSRHARVHAHIEEFLQRLNGMRTHISGNDLRLLGVEPGPLYQQVLKKVLAARLDGFVVTRHEELELARKLIVRK
ncbi:MAG TPA: hypothetical protein PLO85_01925 [Candidatus Omnitrophota bacterium]|nr:hypothetical protein [Candidatus Omnitrophota bacterium]